MSLSTLREIVREACYGLYHHRFRAALSGLGPGGVAGAAAAVDAAGGIAALPRIMLRRPMRTLRLQNFVHRVVGLGTRPHSERPGQ